MLGCKTFRIISDFVSHREGRTIKFSLFHYFLVFKKLFSVVIIKLVSKNHTISASIKILFDNNKSNYISPDIRHTCDYMVFCSWVKVLFSSVNRWFNSLIFFSEKKIVCIYIFEIINETVNDINEKDLIVGIFNLIEI